MAFLVNLSYFNCEIFLTTFYDEDAIVFDDVENSQDENRFIIVGFSLFGKLLLSCFCERGKRSIRIYLLVSYLKLRQKTLRDCVISGKRPLTKWIKAS